jgi:2-C-methyl-D-erythritol 4-phosphate cytidylyltransferase
MTSATAIIVAAGRGTRMGPNVDKLFLEVAGRPVIAHTWAQFDASPAIDDIILVVRAGTEEAFREIAETAGFKKAYRFANGGAERQDSVWNGLQALSAGASIVAIHDGARPCASLDLIAATIEAAADIGAAVAAQRVTDTIKESEDGVAISRTVDRSKLWSVQTPQAFRTEVIRKAIAAARDQGSKLTDDTAACELIGQPVRLVEGLEANPKVTTPADLPVIGALLARRG